MSKHVTLKECVESNTKDSTERLLIELHDFDPVIYPKDVISQFERNKLIEIIASLRHKANTIGKLRAPTITTVPSHLTL